MFNIVLLEPEMPSNTGNIGRTCLLTNSRLHLIRPFPFRMDDKMLKRSGMDYWKEVDLVIHDSIDEFFESLGSGTVYYATTKTEQDYTEVTYRDGDYIMLGNESRGIPEHLLEENRDTCIRIPMITTIQRSLNLANSANIILYEALRQQSFQGLK